MVNTLLCIFPESPFAGVYLSNLKNIISTNVLRSFVLFLPYVHCFSQQYAQISTNLIMHVVHLYSVTFSITLPKCCFLSIREESECNFHIFNANLISLSTSRWPPPFLSSVCSIIISLKAQLFSLTFICAVMCHFLLLCSAW